MRENVNKPFFQEMVIKNGGKCQNDLSCNALLITARGEGGKGQDTEISIFLFDEQYN